jgi:hypothetical protein
MKDSLDRGALRRRVGVLSPGWLAAGAYFGEASDRLMMKSVAGALLAVVLVCGGGSTSGG